jgi:predicted peptidase
MSFGMKIKFLDLAAGVLLLIAPCQMAAQSDADLDPDLMQHRLQFSSKVTRTVELGYLLYLPTDYNPEDKTQVWPLMLFLHGSGERGTNLSLVSAHGPPKLVKQKQEFPFIIVSPQCPTDGRWEDDALLGLMDDIIKRHRVDTNRVYLTGLSMGGFGTWSLGMKHPERFAAIAPICGGGETIDILLESRRKASALKTLGVWAFHGAKDPAVAVAESQRMIDALRAAGCKDVELTIYPEAQHDSWTETYNNPKLFEWFLAHERGKKASR